MKSRGSNPFSVLKHSKTFMEGKDLEEQKSLSNQSYSTQLRKFKRPLRMGKLDLKELETPSFISEKSAQKGQKSVRSISY